MSQSRVNRGNPSLHSSAALLQGGGGGGGGAAGRTQRTASGGGSGQWSSPGPGRPPAGAALKPQTGGSNYPVSPNPNAPAFVAASPSPWSTPSGGGGGGGGRYAKPPAFRGGATGNTAARTLFGGGGSDEAAAGKYLNNSKKNPANWEEHAGDAADGGSGDDGGSLLRGGSAAHPEHWEEHDGQSSTHTLPSASPTSSDTGASLTPFDSPSLGPATYRANASGSPGASSDLSSEVLQLDAKGTDLSLSVLKPKDGPNEISIHMLSLLYDPPVQGCELKPYVSVVDSFGRVTAVHTDEAALNLDFRWFRGQKRICSNTHANCTKAANIQCLSCAKLSPAIIPPHLTYFCSDKCLKDNWPQHKQLHMQQHAQKPREMVQWTYDEEDPVARPDSPSNLHCEFPALLQNTWEETGSERAYVPTTEDIGRAMRLECSPILSAPAAPGKKPDAKSDAITSTSLRNSELNLGTVVRIDTGAVIPVPPPPPPRSVLYAEPSTPINSANTFRTVCYNVLAQIYATRMVYPYTPIWALAWEYRKNLLLREILSHHADVICLQEVQSNHFDTFFQPQLSKHGYDGIFKRKTRDAGNDSSGNQMIDGCATFYRRERFALMEQYGIEFNEAARQHTANRTQLRRLLRGNIALVLVLEELTPPPSSSASAAARRNRKRRLCITNTHIFWDPEFADVKLWQTWVLCQELEKLVLPRNLPLVLCGDLNSLVESSVYELLSTERVEQGDDVFGSGDPSGLLPAPHQVAHRLPLLSAYATIGEPKYTNYTSNFIGVLDYIWFTRTHLRCVACLDVDDESLLRQHTALPSPLYPSDHIPLVTTLEFLDA